MKQIGFIILFVLVIYSLAAHPAYNGWEQHKLSGKVRIMAQNPQLGNPQRIYVFHPDGKISKIYSFINIYGWDSSVPLDYFVDNEADKMARIWYDELEDNNIITTYSYESRDGRIVACTGRDIFGKISEKTEYFYEVDELSRSVTKDKFRQNTHYWNSTPLHTQTVNYDSFGNVESEHDYYEEINDASNQYTYEYDLRGNIITVFMHDGGEKYEACTSNYVYYEPISSVSASSSLKAYPVKNIMDNDPRTTWVAGTKPDGISDWVLLTLDDETFVKSLDIAPGFACVKDGRDLFPLNNRLKRITITLSSGKPIIVDFNGKESKFRIPINASTKTIKITINTIYPGSKWRDTCISELGVNSR